MAAKTFTTDEVRISVQTNQGSLDANPKYFTIPAASCNVKATEGFVDIDTITTGGEPSGSFLSGIEDIAGNISYNMQYALMRWVNEMSIGEGTTVDLAALDWQASTVYAVGQVAKGTTPATDDLVVFEVTGTGTSDATAPDTTLLADGDTVEDNEIIWKVRKARIQKTTGGITKCQKRFAIEAKISSECGSDVFYFRKLDCVIGSLGLSFAKDGSMLKADMAVQGAISESNIATDGSVDTAYEDLSAISGSTELQLENSVYIKQSDIDFTLAGVASEYITTFSLNLDNGVNSQNLLSKQAGKNSKLIYSSKRALTGSISSAFDAVQFAKMDGQTTQEAVVTMDNGDGEYLEYKLPHIKLSKTEPDYSNDMAMLDPDYSAEYKEGSGSALQFESHSTAVDFS